MRLPSETFTLTPRKTPKAPIQELSDLSHHTRSHHTHIISPTGGGKSQLIQHMIYQDLLRKDCSIFLIEPKGDSVDALRRLKIFQDEPDRLVVLNPIEEPALNFFKAIPDDLDENIAKIIRPQIIKAYSDAINASDTDLPRNQRSALRNVITLALSLNNPNLITILDILDDRPKVTRDKTAYEGSAYLNEIEALGEMDIRFFKTQFYEGRFNESRRALSGKIQDIAGVFGKTFTASRNSVDIYKRMETPGSLTLINTNEPDITLEPSSFFGRIMIAQIFAAALQRIPRNSSRLPSYLYIDEAHMYLDDTAESILARSRSFGLGLILAHQTLSQLKRVSTTLYSTVMDNPVTRLARPGDSDKEEIADRMGTTTPHFFNSLKLIEKVSSEFACFVRDIGMEHAVRITVPLGQVENAERMTDDAFAQSKQRNKDSLADQPPDQRPPSNSIRAAPGDISDAWDA